MIPPPPPTTPHPTPLQHLLSPALPNTIMPASLRQLRVSVSSDLSHLWAVQVPFFTDLDNWSQIQICIR